MKNSFPLAALALALSLSGPAAVLAQTPSAHAMQGPVATVESFGVDQLQTLAPGSELAFRLNGTPGASVRLQIAGATGEVQMTETRPGSYVGRYTVRSRDRLSAASLVTAWVTRDGQTISVAMDQSLVRGARSPAPQSLARISDFNVTARDRVRPGDEISFMLSGAPAGAARVVVQGVSTPIALTEVRRGVYEGRYTLRRGDRVTRDLDATGFLVVNRQESSQRFTRGAGDRDHANANANGSDRRGSERRAAAATCIDCGVVESVNLVTVKGDKPNVLGTIAGGLLGGVLGNQVGGGTGKDLATIAGAVGGAYAGNRVENNMDKTQVYRMLVRLDSGETRSIDYATDPGLQVGTLVRFDNGTVVVQ
jgi:outer membrane lipoprotein SlyB